MIYDAIAGRRKADGGGVVGGAVRACAGKAVGGGSTVGVGSD